MAEVASHEEYEEVEYYEGEEGEYEEVDEGDYYEEQTLEEHEVDDVAQIPPAQEPVYEPAPEPAPAPPPSRPAHPLFGGAAKNELAAAANRMSSQREANERNDLPPPPPPATSRPPDAVASAPKQPQNAASANPMADQVALMAIRRQERVNAQEEEHVAPPPRHTADPVTKSPVFAHAKLRKTPSEAQREQQQQQQMQQHAAPVAFSQARLGSAQGGVDTRAAPQQQSYGAQPDHAGPPPGVAAYGQASNVDEEEPEEYYPEQPKYERVLVSKQEPQVVTQHRVIQNDPEYEIIEYRICCTIL